MKTILPGCAVLSIASFLSLSAAEPIAAESAETVPAAPAAEAAPVAEAQVEAKIGAFRLSAVREKGPPPETLLRGQVKVAVTSSRARFKRPVFSVSALFDVGGVWRYYDAICLEQRTSKGPALGREQTLKRMSLKQPEVTASAWGQLVYGDSKEGFFRRCGIDYDGARLIAYRVEVWQNGVLVASADSDSSAAKRLGVPADWYLKGRHEGKMVYHWPHPAVDVQPAAGAQPQPPVDRAQRRKERQERRARRQQQAE